MYVYIYTYMYVYIYTYSLSSQEHSKTAQHLGTSWVFIFFNPSPSVASTTLASPRRTCGTHRATELKTRQGLPQGNSSAQKWVAMAFLPTAVYWDMMKYNISNIYTPSMFGKLPSVCYAIYSPCLHHMRIVYIWTIFLCDSHLQQLNPSTLTLPKQISSV